MKRVLYIILVLFELFIGSLLMSSLWMSSLYIPVAIAAVALLALLVWQIVLYARASDASRKRKILFNIAVAMLVPIVVFFATYIVIAAAFVIAFAEI